MVTTSQTNKQLSRSTDGLENEEKDNLATTVFPPYHQEYRGVVKEKELRNEVDGRRRRETDKQTDRQTKLPGKKQTDIWT